MKPQQELTGTFNRIRWSKPDGSWLIANLMDGTTVVGAASPGMFINGVDYLFAGRWENNPSYGDQFKFESVIAREPITDSSVMSYLQKFAFGSGAGFGPVKARKLLAEVGAEKCLATLKSDPKKVAAITGITPQNAKRLAADLIEVEQFESTRMQLVQLFQGRGFSQKLIEDVIADFGVCAADRIRRDPFTMLVRRYPSAGFMRCDQLYMDLGLPTHRLKRQTICLWHQIQKASGSIWINAKDASAELSRLVSSQVNPKKAIELGLRSKWLESYRDSAGTLWLAEREDAINERLINKYSLALQGGQDGSTHRQSESSSAIDLVV